MRTSAGHALHEYALLLGLLAVLSIGSLQLMGGNISELLGQSGRSANQSKLDQLFGLIGAKTGGNGNSGGNASGNLPASGQPATGSGSTQEFALRIDPNTGRVVISNSSSGEKNATSTEGSQLMTQASSMLAALANENTADGEPLSSDIQQLLKRMAANGSELSVQMRDFDALQQHFDDIHQQVAEQRAQGQYGGPPYYTADFVQQKVHYTEQYIQFSENYHQLQNLLAGMNQQDPAYSRLQKQVNDYSGAISAMAYLNTGEPFYSQFHLTHAKPADLMGALAKNPHVANYFQQIQQQAGHLDALQQEAIFQQQTMAMGRQLMVGTPMTADSVLAISLPGLSLAHTP